VSWQKKKLTSPWPGSSYYGLPQRLLREALRIVDEVPVTAAGNIRNLDLRRDLMVEAK
jgi:hypothetical protein